ncbi:hypothetical protein NDU88_003772 [Pleurodeles waltl]|uniref:Uncharacterized protein n=1 Tax=Pleurodeles waltl TaxID=8319 RepID=A0AAV7M798_PLEWA|nr:hypothetical protein NDU88_003772 [Pleurodeles waltl]
MAGTNGVKAPQEPCLWGGPEDKDQYGGSHPGACQSPGLGPSRGPLAQTRKGSLPRPDGLPGPGPLGYGRLEQGSARPTARWGHSWGP